MADTLLEILKEIEVLWDTHPVLRVLPIIGVLVALLTSIKNARKFVVRYANFVAQFFYFITVKHYLIVYKLSKNERKEAAPSLSLPVNRLRFRGGALWNDGSEMDECGPYCQTCFKKNDILIPISYDAYDAQNGYYYCDTCKNRFPLKQYEHAKNEQACKNAKGIIIPSSKTSKLKTNKMEEDVMKFIASSEHRSKPEHEIKNCDHAKGLSNGEFNKLKHNLRQKGFIKVFVSNMGSRHEGNPIWSLLPKGMENLKFERVDN